MTYRSVTPHFGFYENETSITYILSTGAGGQNVNKVATAAQLRFNVHMAKGLSDRVKQRLLEVAGSRVTVNGEIVLTGRRFRSQVRNKEDVLERLASLIVEAAQKREFRVPTRPTKGSRQRRLEGKTHRSAVKKNRRFRFDE
ncbi:peptidyl-tRNA hydrolase domain protein [Neokomagataea thailandica NBRC 106555]|uniref:Aminoacyl-tRNA hydrolase n=2 Tax=Neokomagataea TaxID=1223423 RepID=A0A4Y6VAR2_9PROT|nr:MULTISPECIES: alternative ribosome rescue aminoacyl-tRNA hydrolase ArfB [Neokomagataea]QDH25455.1 aminoacyl-tRNA hydrolase [Neokomagataea tanensis]GBR50767.1 peptidyl-tRNA hydrolase domain protein [Neokomagataea thailandica NBRC 106555]